MWELLSSFSRRSYTLPRKAAGRWPQVNKSNSKRCEFSWKCVAYYLWLGSKLGRGTFPVPACRAKWKQFEHCISPWVHWHLRIPPPHRQNQHAWQVSSTSHDLPKLLPPRLQKFRARSNVIHVAKPKLGQAAIWRYIRGNYLFLLCLFRWNGWKMKT